MIDAKLHRQLDAFLKQSGRNAWLTGKYLRVYVRKDARWLNAREPIDLDEWRAKRTPCIDLANISDMRVTNQLQGIFPAFMDYLESKPFAIFVESVQHQQLCWYYERRGYVLLPKSNPPSYYRLTEGTR
jgi:hypothetical protein